MVRVEVRVGWGWVGVVVRDLDRVLIRVGLGFKLVLVRGYMSARVP